MLFARDITLPVTNMRPELFFLCLGFASWCSGDRQTPRQNDTNHGQWQSALSDLEEKFTGIIDALRFDLHNLEEANDALSVKIASLESASAASMPDAPLVSFRGAIGGDVTVNHPEVVKFRVVHENQGAGYDSSTGKFTCPVSGLYNFGVHLMSNTRYLEFAMSKGSHYLLLLLLQPTDNHWFTDSGAISTHCNKGEEVFVRVHWGPGASTVLHGPWNFFSGHLVRAD